MAKKSASLVRRPRRRPRTEMSTGTISTTNFCLASHRKKPPRCCESAYLSGIVLTVSVASIFSATNQKRSSGCQGWRLTVGS
jgi:hypothetical protein